MGGKLGGSFAGWSDIHMTTEGSKEAEVGWFTGTDGERGMIAVIMDRAVGQAEEMVECIRPINSRKGGALQ